MSINSKLLTAEALDLLLKGEFGLEKENLRTDKKGQLSHEPHPFIGDPHRDRDFCENQVELITDVYYSIDEAWDSLYKLNNETKSIIADIGEGEILWPFSNPPYIKGEDDIPVAIFDGGLAYKTEYRNYLADKYGKKKMLYSGIHFNFSFCNELLLQDFVNKGYVDYIQYKNHFYLDLAQKVLNYSWLIVYLTAASPVFDGSFFDNADFGKTIVSKYASARCSEIGYWNDFVPILDFSSVDAYVDSINKYVVSGQLRQASELYYPVRLKPRGENNHINIGKNGVNHIELRMLDLNPLSPAGLNKTDMEFIFCLMIYFAITPGISLDADEQQAAIAKMKRAALLNPGKDIREEGISLLDDMKKVLTANLSDHSLLDCIDYEYEKLIDDSKRYANIIASEYGENYVEAVLGECS